MNAPNPSGSALYAERASLPPLPPEPAFLESLRIQLRVIGALLLREALTRYGRHNIGLMWIFLEPMIFTIGVTILWNILKPHKGDSISITAFILTGYSTILLWRNMPGRCVQALQPNLSLLFHRQVKPIDVYIARLTLEGVGATTSFIVLTILFNFMGMKELPRDYLTMWAAWFLLAWYGASLGLFIGALSERSEIVEKLWHPCQYLLIPLSGALFMLSALPHALRDVLLYLPTVHCTEMLRSGYFASTHEWFYSVSYVVGFNMVLTLLGLMQIRIISKKITPE
jgi:capsular polysaccharide transport system permease protein